MKPLPTNLFDWHSIGLLISLSIFLFLGTASGHAQQREIDTTYKVSFADKMIVKLNLDTEIDTYILNNPEGEQDLTLTSNNNYRVFLSLDYEFIGASIGFSPEFLPGNDDGDRKGTSDFTDIRFRFFLGDWVQGLQYKNVKGFYVENTGDFISNWDAGSDPYILIPSLKAVTYGMSTAYVFNKNFSYRNNLYQTEWQKKSAGSFVPTLLYDYSIFSFNEGGLDSREGIFTIRIAPTYYYTFVFAKNWFVSPTISPSIGVRFAKTRSNIDNNTEIDKSTALTRSIEGGIQLGYSSERIIFGCNFFGNANWYNNENNATIENDILYGVLYFGYRFDPPAFIKKPFNWAMGK